MKPASALTAAILAASLVPVAGTAQETYGEKGYVGDPGYEVVVVEADVYVPPVETTVYVDAHVDIAPVSYGCIMGHGVLQRGTLICPGH